MGPDLLASESIAQVPEGFRPSRKRRLSGINKKTMAGVQPTGSARTPTIRAKIGKRAHLRHALKADHPMLSTHSLGPDLLNAIKFSVALEAQLN